MKLIQLFLTLSLLVFTTACDRAFQFASTLPAPERLVCNASPEDLNVPALVQQGQTFAMSYAYLDVKWTLTLGSNVIRFEGNPIETSLNTVGTYQGLVEGQNRCGEAVSENFEIKVIEAVEGLSIVINNNDTYTKTLSSNLALSALGALEMYVTNTPNCLSGGTWESYKQSKTWTLGESNKLTRVYVKYKNPVMETPCISDDITHDDIAPLTRFVSVPSGTTSATTAVVEFDAEDNLSGVKALYCRIDQQPFKVCQKTETFSGLADGTHSVYVYAEDNAGNVSVVDGRSWTIDTSIPSVRITHAPTDPSNSKNAEFRFVGEDNGQPITNFECSLDNSAFAACTSPKNYTNLAEGSHTFKVRAKDGANNLSAVATHTWNIDSVAPVVRFTSVPSSPTADTSATFEFTINETGLGLLSVTCQLDNTTAVDCTSPHVLNNLSNAVHTFKVVATDKAGNKGSATHTWEVNDKIQVHPITIVEGIGESDILFLMDVTGSMYREYNDYIFSQFRNFLSNLNGMNYRIGVATSDYRDGENSPYREGKIVPLEGSPNEFMITPQTNNLQNRFLNTLSRREVTCVAGTWSGPNGTFCAQGGWNKPTSTQIIKSGLRTIDHPLNASFFRGHAALNVVIVSDSDEACSEGMNGPEGLCSPQDIEHRPETLADALRAKFPDKQIKVHSLIHRQGDTGCDQGSEAIGHTYARLSQLTGGITRSICKPTPSEGNAIADQIQANSIPEYQLRCVPRDLDGDGKPDVSVTYNPQPSTPISHTVVGDKIRFSPTPAAGTVVTLRYTCP